MKNVTPQELPQSWGREVGAVVWYELRHLLAAAALLSAVYVATEQTGLRPQLANRLKPGAEEVYNTLPINPSLDEFKKIVEAVAGSKRINYGVTCMPAYIYHMQSDIADIPLDSSTHYMTDETARDEGWLPVATYTFVGAEWSEDALSVTNNEAFKTYAHDYFGAWDYLDAVYGSCGTARGNAYDTQNGVFLAATSPVAMGYNTFYVRTLP